MKLNKILLLAISSILVLPLLAACDGESPDQKAAYEAAQQQRMQQREQQRPDGSNAGTPGVAPGTEENAGK